MLFALVTMVFLILSPLSYGEQMEGALLDIRPWGYHNQQGELDGQLVDIINLLEERSGIKMDVELKPLRRITQELAENSVDFSILILRDSYKEKVDVVGQVTTFDLYMIHAPTCHKSVTEIDTIGLLLGQDIFLKGLHKLNVFPEVIFAKNNEQLYSLLKKQRIDAIISPDIVVEDKAFNSPRVEKISHVKVYLLLSKDKSGQSRPQLEGLRASLEQMRLDGSLGKVLARKH